MIQNQTSDETKIAIISTNIQFIQKDISDIKLALREYVTRDSLIQAAKDTEGRLTKLEGARNIQNWLSPILSAILGSVLTFLIIEYFMHQVR